MKKVSRIFGFLVAKLIFFSLTVIAVPIKRNSESNDQNISFEDKTYNAYVEELLQNYNYKNYFAAIFQDDKIRDDFVKFLNDGLTQQVKDDLRGLRVYKKVGDADVPVVMFSSQMDSWLGILPQWKRSKRYIFKRIEDYLSQHPEVLHHFTQTVKP